MIWKKIRHAHPLLMKLVDGNAPDCHQHIVHTVVIDAEEIMKLLGKLLKVELVEAKQLFYIRLFTDDRDIWSELSSNADVQDAIDGTIDDQETDGSEELVKNSDTEADYGKDICRNVDWPRLAYSIIVEALKNFKNKPRSSKEACLFFSPSSINESALTISRGEILCIKRYRPYLKGSFFNSYYHFGVYVGNIVTKEGKHLKEAVIELNQNSNKNIEIRAIPMVMDTNGSECFLSQEPEIKHPLLLFKVIYKGRTQIDKDATADRAQQIYMQPGEYLEKYSLLSNNCEHFTNICAFGFPQCEQHATFLMTTLPNFMKLLSPVLREGFTRLLTLMGEIAENMLKNIPHFVGEAAALAILMIELAVRIIWDIYLLKESGELTWKKCLRVLKIRLFPMGPELIVATCALLISIFLGPLGILWGIGYMFVLLMLRFFARPRIQRWIEEKEEESLHNFRQWPPHAVAKLAVATSEDDDFATLVAEFESKKLCGETILGLIYEQQKNGSTHQLENILNFLGPDRLKRFKENVKVILGSCDYFERVSNSIELSYEKSSLLIDLSDGSNFTVSQLLETARFHWGINFSKVKWSLKTKGPTGEMNRVIASWNIPNSNKRLIYVLPDDVMKIELLYEQHGNCITA